MIVSEYKGCDIFRQAHAETQTVSVRVRDGINLIYVREMPYVTLKHAIELMGLARELAHDYIDQRENDQ
jgi:hypothetical protein